MDGNNFAVQGGRNVPQGAVPLGMKPGQAPALLGQQFTVGVQPVQGVFPGAPAQAIPGQQQQAQISSPQLPKGAQPVRLHQMAGPIPQQQGIMPQAAPQQVLPQRPVAPQAAPPPQPQLGGTEVRTVVVEGLGPDGMKYTAEFDAVFPAGTKLLGVRY